VIKEIPAHRILLIGGGLYMHSMLRDAVHGLETIVICRVGTLDTISDISQNRAVIVLSDDSPIADWVTTARLISAAWPIDSIAAFSEVDQDKTAAIAASLKLPFHHPRTVLWVNDKSEMRRRLSELGIKQIQYRTVRTPSELLAFADEIDLPLIVKPSRGRGSVGVRLIRSKDDLAESLQRAAVAKAPRSSPSTPIAEQFVAGPRLTIEALTDNGSHYITNVTECFVTDATRVAFAYVAPPINVSQNDIDSAILHVREVLDGLQIERGVTNTDVVIGPAGPVVLETHLRASGGRLPEMGLASTGVDILQLWVLQIALFDIRGMLSEAMPGGVAVPHKASAVRMLVTERSGTLERIEGWQAARNIPGVIAADQLITDGTPLHGAESDFSRLAFVQAIASNPHEALATAERGIAQLTLQVRPDPHG
jgi:biotin carboxylase